MYKTVLDSDRCNTVLVIGVRLYKTVLDSDRCKTV